MSDDNSMNDPILASLHVTPQVRDTMAALLDANPTWRAAFDTQPRFSGDLLLITRAIVGVLNGSGDFLPIEELNLSVRGYNVLKREGVNTVGELCAKTRDDLYDMRNMGVKAVDQIEAQLATVGKSLKEGPK
jgi:DNA-directed RNA polymerase alpha subunit